MRKWKRAAAIALTAAMGMSTRLRTEGRNKRRSQNGGKCRGDRREYFF